VGSAPLLFQPGFSLAAPAAKTGLQAPKLVLLLVADQFRADNLARYGSMFVEGGLKRLLRQGAFAIGRYGQQNTYTGPGHALIATGSYGYLNGITQNKFWNRQSGKAESMLYDPQATVLGEKELSLDDDSSPRNLVGSTVFDELRFTSKESRVLGVALKARGAILLGGHLGRAYFFSDQTGEFTTSTFYAKDLPDWVKDWNKKKLADAGFNKPWERLLPVESYPTLDDSPYEADLKGLGRVFPHAVNGKLQAPGPAFYETISYVPLGLDLTMDFVRAALAGEQLGKRGVTDVLAVSVSTTDLAGHLFGPLSHEYQDMVLRLDRAIAALLTDLDKQYKPGEVMIMFTADHGAAPIPDEMAQHNMFATRVKKPSIKEKINKALSEHFGVAGDWVVALEDPSVYLSPKLIAQAKADPSVVEEVAGRAALELPGMLGYYTRTQLLRGWLPPTDAAVAVSRSYFPTRGGEVVLVSAPFCFWGKYGDKELGTSHGSFYRYDTDVPMIFNGPWFVPGEYGVVDMVDFAATISHVLRTTPPASAAGRPLNAALKPYPR
jgi:predicted AlkP superfamily pyrophosphatase or phosphodiesterase